MSINDVKPLPRILLVEDHALTRRLMHDMLQERATVETSASAKEALEKANARIFDVLILDISLGKGKNGIDVLKTLRQDPQYQTTPMIACTTLSAASYKQRLLKAGFDAYLAKPFEEDDLHQLVKQLTAASRHTNSCGSG